jgi:hypothetical protein
MRPGIHVLYSRIILWVAAIQLLTAGLWHSIWIFTGNQAWLNAAFNYQGSVYFILLDLFGLWLCIAAWKEFREGESLGAAWLLISIATGFRLAGDLFTHWLCLDTFVNPLHYLWPVWNASAAKQMQMWGTAVAGPLFMGVLAVGLFQGLRHYREIGMLGTLRSYDYVLVGGAAVYAVYVLVTVVRIAVHTPSLIRTSWMLTWPNDMMLAVLLLEAILLFRTAVDMGQGYLACVWGAFAIAIFLTTVESAGLWLTNFGYLPYPENSPLWYIWFVWAAAFALGPAYQVDAVRIAEFRMNAPNGTPRNTPIIPAYPGGRPQ